MLNLARVLTLTLVAVLALVATAAAGGGSPFNGHYAGTSLNGRQHVDVNINGGKARTANLKLRCPGRRTIFADFRLSERLAAKGRLHRSGSLVSSLRTRRRDSQARDARRGRPSDGHDDGDRRQPRNPPRRVRAEALPGLALGASYN